MNGFYKFFENVSGKNAKELCEVYGECKQPFKEMSKYGKEIEGIYFAEIQQSNNLLFSVEFDADHDTIILFDGEKFIHKGLNETVLKQKENKEKDNEMSDDEKQSFIDGIEEIKESILLIQNDDLTKYSLVSVVGMDRQELMDVLSAMSEDDKRSIQAYLESKGAWTYEIANEDTKEFGVYHLDVRYNPDTEELVDMKTEELVDMKRSGREEKESNSIKKSNRKGHCR